MTKKITFTNHGFIVSNKINNKYYSGYINYLGEKILDTKYSEIIRIHDTTLTDDIYLVAIKDGKASLYKNKKTILKNEYEDIQYNVVNKKLILQKNQKQGIADLNGKIIIPIQYENIIVAGNCINAQNDGEVTLFKPDGSKIPDTNFISIFPSKNEKYIICVNKEDKYGVIDQNNNSIIENKYTYIDYLWDDYFIAKSNESFGIINTLGKKILDFKYDMLQKIDGTEVIEVIQNNETSFLDKEFKEVAKFKQIKIELENEYIKLYSIDEKELTYLDKTGKVVDSKNILNENKLFAKKENNRWGFINKSGKFEIEAKFDYVTEFNKYGFAGIMVNNKWGVIDINGNIIEEPKYELESESLPTFIGKYYEYYLGYGEKFFTAK